MIELSAVNCFNPVPVESMMSISKNIQNASQLENFSFTPFLGLDEIVYNYEIMIKLARLPNLERLVIQYPGDSEEIDPFLFSDFDLNHCFPKLTNLVLNYSNAKFSTVLEVFLLASKLPSINKIEISGADISDKETDILYEVRFKNSPIDVSISSKKIPFELW